MIPLDFNSFSGYLQNSTPVYLTFHSYNDMFSNNILNLHVQYTEQFDIDFLLWPGNYTGLYREVGQGGGQGGGRGGGEVPP